MCRWRFPNDTLLAVEPGTLGGAGRDKFGIEVDILEIRMLDLVKDGRCFFLFLFFTRMGWQVNGLGRIQGHKQEARVPDDQSDSGWQVGTGRD